MNKFKNFLTFCTNYLYNLKLSVNKFLSMEKDKKYDKDEQFKEVAVTKKYVIRLDDGNLDDLPEVFDKEAIRRQRASGSGPSFIRVTDHSAKMRYEIERFKRERAERERLKKEQQEAEKTKSSSHTEKVESRSRSNSSSLSK